MNYIRGEFFQDLCGTQLSIPEFFPFESETRQASDAYTYTDTNNKPFIYVNADLIKNIHEDLSSENVAEHIRSKQVHLESGPIDIYSILEKMKNPFSLVLHCNDQPFEKEELRYFDIKNCKKIYAQNVLVTDSRVVPLPIGLGNHYWRYGDLNAMGSIELPCNKTKDIFFNFQVEGGCRDIKRPTCYKKCIELNIPWIPTVKPQLEYLQNLKDYKFIVSPEGNGVDCHRTWEALYLKTIPIVDRSLVTEYFSKYFPMVLVDDWDTFTLDQLEGVYEKADWSNMHLLDFKNFVKEFIND